MLEDTPTDRRGRRRAERDLADLSKKRNKEIDICLIVCLLLLVVSGLGAWMWMGMQDASAQGANYESPSESSPSSTGTQGDSAISIVQAETARPTVEPGRPTVTPSDVPSLRPTFTLSQLPTLQPSKTPSWSPTMLPSNLPSAAPSTQSAWIANILLDVASDKNPYQRKAMEWIVGKGNTIIMGASDEIPFEELVIQLYALTCTYYSTYQVPNDVTDALLENKVVQPWKTSRRWMMSGSNGGCDWYGVTCNSRGQVEKIKLPNNQLSGSIPPELALLKDSLLYLELYNNYIHNAGEFGNSFLGEMTNLQYLYLGQTFFENDGVPPELSKLSNLVELDISFTSWFGPLTSNPWSRLTNLEYLVMNGNVFNTTLPEELVRLPKLRYLYMVDSFVKGDLEWVSRMPAIRELWIDHNPLSTRIPESLSRASTLASFSAGNCGLTGAIPASLGSLARTMKHLWLNNNALSSDIPGELSKLSQLQTLSLKGNEFNGVVPSEICFQQERLQTVEVDPSVPCECCTCCGHNGISVQSIGTRIWKDQSN
ncbi:MAG: hypothetical protein SGBAC_004154 [Bacillariaceae sp.]